MFLIIINYLRPQTPSLAKTPPIFLKEKLKKYTKYFNNFKFIQIKMYNRLH